MFNEAYVDGSPREQAAREYGDELCNLTHHCSDGSRGNCFVCNAERSYATATDLCLPCICSRTLA
jgi:hypothetical protein